VLLVANPRRALAGMATGFGAAITALVAVTVWTHGGFLTHILAYNINRFALVNGLDILITFGMHFGMVAVAVVALLPRVNRLRAAARRDGGLAVHLRADAGDAALAMVLAYLALATMMMGLIFKSGSSINYFLEWLFLVGILAGWGIADFVAAEQAGRVVAALPWLLSLQVLAFCAFYETEFERREPFAGDYARIATVVRAAPGPVISDDMVLLLRSGKPVVIEPSIFAELSARKVIDDRTLLAEIRSRRISFVLTENDPGDPTFDARYTPAMTRAILTAYPQTVTLAERYRLRFPAGPLPVWAKALRTGNR